MKKLLAALSLAVTMTGCVSIDHRVSYVENFQSLDGLDLAVVVESNNPTAANRMDQVLSRYWSEANEASGHQVETVSLTTSALMHGYEEAVKRYIKNNPEFTGAIAFVNMNNQTYSTGSHTQYNEFTNSATTSNTSANASAMRVIIATQESGTVFMGMYQGSSSNTGANSIMRAVSSTNSNEGYIAGAIIQDLQANGILTR